MSDEVIGEAAPKGAKRGRGRARARGQDGLFQVVGAELIARAVDGEIGVCAARRPGWIAKQLGLSGPKSVTRWRKKKARPELAQAIALSALFPWMPIAVWLTAEERQMVQAAQTMGQILAAEPPPNPKTQNRKKKKDDPRQVTLDEMITMKTPPPPPKTKPQALPVIDEPDLGDWDPSFEGAP